ncbi:MAG: DUF2784 domain-containing protein [Spirochaeta sp.]
MSTGVLEFLDSFFFAFHTAYIVFNLVGWIPQFTRRIHLISIGVTLFSWIVLGFRYGWGYCFVTDWHWIVMRRLGKPPKVRSYIQYLVHELTGYTPPAEITIETTQWVFVVLVCITAAVNIRDAARKQRRIQD